MAAAAHTEPCVDPVLPHPSRLGLLVWFVVQWILIPVEFVLKFPFLLIGFFADLDAGDLLYGLLNAPARFISPSKLALRLSRNPTKHEAALDREFARLAGEIERQRSSWHTIIYHHGDVYTDTAVYTPHGEVVSGAGFPLHRREFRGTPVSVLIRLAHQHHFALGVPKNLRQGVYLRPTHRKTL